MLFLARIVDGLSGGNISTARAYVADVTEPKDRARAYGLIGAAFGLGFILGPALSGVLAQGQLHGADLGGRGAHARRDGRWRGSGCPKRSIARTPARATRSGYLPELLRRPGLRRVLAIDFIYWFAFAIFQTTFALFAARRFGFDASQTGYFFAAFGVLGAIVQGGFIRPIVRRLGDKATFIARARLRRDRAGRGARCAHSVPLFALALVPLALGIGFGHPTVSSLVSRAARGDEQGRVQGAASAVESLGRTLGPVWGNASLQRFGEAMPYLSAAGVPADHAGDRRSAITSATALKRKLKSEALTH